MSNENIDSNGFRKNVGIVLYNSDGNVLLASRVGKKGWQFPQGGINLNESEDDALYRELYEEIGLQKKDVKIVYRTNNWLKYRLPDQYIRKDSKDYCIGQKQKWFLLKLICDESKISLKKGDTPEFDYWHWVSYWKPVSKVIFFKKQIYNSVLLEFRSIVFDGNGPSRPRWWPEHWKNDCEKEQ